MSVSARLQDPGLEKQAARRFVSLSRGRRPSSGRARLGGVLANALIVFVCLAWFTPIFQLVAVALRTASATARSGWWHIFYQPFVTFENFVSGAQLVNLSSTLPSTIELTLPAVVLAVLFSAYGGFVLAIHRFRGRAAVYGILVALMAVPPQLTFSPLITLFSAVHLSGHIAAVWLFQAGYTVPFGVFLVRGFMYTIPDELLKAARIDGASDLRIFLQITLPLTAPILASLAILQFMWSWNDLLTPLIFVGVTSSVAPITLQLAGLMQGVVTVANAMNQIAAGAIIAILPPVTIIVVLQRYFVAGITGGAIKG